MSLVYYHVLYDEIFESVHIDAHFYGLIPGVKWEELLILSEI